MKGYIRVAIYKDGVRYFYRTEKNPFFTEALNVDEAEGKLFYAGIKYEDIQREAEFKNTDM